MTEVTGAALAAHPFLRGMRDDHLAALAAVASETRFPAGHRVFEAGGYAGRFWLLQTGRVHLDLQLPREGLVVVDTVGMGGVLGCSWLFPPYRWAFGAVCLRPVEAFELDADAVRKRCDADPEFGYELTRRLIVVVGHRLQGARTRLLTRPAGLL